MEQTKKIPSGFSLRLNPQFVRNIVIVVGVVAVWRGLWNIIDEYLLPEMPLVSNILSIVIGVLILYLPDGNIDELH